MKQTDITGNISNLKPPCALNALEMADVEQNSDAGDEVATVTGNPQGKVFLLQADMDALPMEEKSGLPFASQRSRAHTCGHDMHNRHAAGRGPDAEGAGKGAERARQIHVPARGGGTGRGQIHGGGRHFRKSPRGRGHGGPYDPHDSGGPWGPI